MSAPTQCDKCSCQDLKWVEFTSKAGNQVKGWKCQNKSCSNLIFAPKGNSGAKPNNAWPAKTPDDKLARIERKLDRLIILCGGVSGEGAMGNPEDDASPF